VPSYRRERNQAESCLPKLTQGKADMNDTAQPCCCTIQNLVFVPGSWPGLLKSLEFPEKWERLCYANEVTHCWPLDGFRMGAGDHRKTHHIQRGLERLGSLCSQGANQSLMEFMRTADTWAQ
jgi:hypothetical protein